MKILSYGTHYVRLKDDLPMTDAILSRGHIRTYSDGVLSITNIQPSDHGSYVCIISTSSSNSVHSKPAVITVKCKLFSFCLWLELKKLYNEDPPMPSRSHQTKNLTLIRGSTGICPCLLDAYPPVQSVSWYRNGISIPIESKGNSEK